MDSRVRVGMAVLGLLGGFGCWENTTVSGGDSESETVSDGSDGDTDSHSESETAFDSSDGDTDTDSGIESTDHDDRCDDGAEPTCRMVPPECTDYEILAYQDDCYRCVNPATCLPWGEPGCETDDDCTGALFCDPCGTSSCPTCKDCLGACFPHPTTM